MNSLLLGVKAKPLFPCFILLPLGLQPYRQEVVRPLGAHPDRGGWSPRVHSTCLCPITRKPIPFHRTLGVPPPHEQPEVGLTQLTPIAVRPLGLLEARAAEGCLARNPPGKLGLSIFSREAGSY